MAKDDKTVFDPGATKRECDETIYESAQTMPDTATTLLDGDSMAAAALSDAAKRTDAPASNLYIKKGDTLLDTYKVGSDAIEGGMGSVWRVHHALWNTDLAMKRPQPQCFATERSKADFIHECGAWINLGMHPNIVSCYYVREIFGTPSIFSEWMDGGSLESAIKNQTLYEGSEAGQQERILDIAIQFARGLHYAHEAGLIHQDVKPDNLLLTKESDAKVADFGLAKARAVLTAAERASNVPQNTDSGRTIASPSGGYTPAYCSMEQMDGKTLTRRTDIYSWAVSVMEMYVGARPWANGVVAGLSCRGYFEDARLPMPEALKDLLAKCLEVEPDDRPHDFAQIEAELLNIYLAETGCDYLRPAPKAAADTADSLNNRALSYIDLGKPEEAERYLAAAEALDDANALHNRIWFDLTHNRIGMGEAIERAQAYFKRRNTMEAAVFLVKLRAHNDEAELDTSVFDSVSAANRLALEELFLQHGGGDNAKQMSYAPEPFGAGIPEINGAFVHPNHQYAIVETYCITSSPGSICHYFLVNLQSNCIEREYQKHPHVGIASASHMQLDDSCRYVLLCDNEKERSMLHRIDEDEAFLQIDGYSDVFFVRDRLYGVRRLDDKLSAFDITARLDGGTETGDRALYEIPLTHGKQHLQGLYFSQNATRFLFFPAREREFYIYESTTGRLVHKQFIADNKLDHYTFNRFIVDDGDRFAIHLDSGYRMCLYDLKRGYCARSMLYSAPPASIVRNGCVWDGGQHPVILAWNHYLSNNNDADACRARLYPLPDLSTVLPYTVSRISATKTLQAAQEQCKAAMQDIIERLRQADIAGALACWKTAHSIAGFTETAGYEQADEALARYCSRTAVTECRAVQHAASWKQDEKLVCVTDQCLFTYDSEHVLRRYETDSWQCAWSVRICDSGIRIRVDASYSGDVVALIIQPGTLLVLDGRSGRIIAKENIAKLTNCDHEIMLYPNGEKLFFSGHVYNAKKFTTDYRTRMFEALVFPRFRIRKLYGLNALPQTLNNLLGQPERDMPLYRVYTSDRRFYVYRLPDDEVLYAAKGDMRIAELAGFWDPMFSRDGRRLYGNTADGIKVYALRYEYSFPGIMDWGKGAAHILSRFRSLFPKWGEEEFAFLMKHLQNCGFGYLRAEGVRAQLKALDK